jgi:hypothetical protein
VNDYRVAIIDRWEWQKSVIDKDLTSPPLSLTKGDRYLVYGSGSGDWIGQDGNIAEFDGGAWFFVDRQQGMAVFVKDENKWYVYTTVWSKFIQSPIVKQTEVDFGATPISESSFTITDIDVISSSHIEGSIAYEAPTGKDLDELEMDEIDLKFGVGIGQFTIYAKGMEGYLHDKFKINYLIG